MLFALLLTVPLVSSLEEPQSENRRHDEVDADEYGGELMVEVEVEEEDATPVFVATREWQVVQEGQPIPPGLHVRMDLQTGLREAKLLDDPQEEEGRSTEEESEGGLKEEEEEGRVEEGKEKEQRRRGEKQEQEEEKETVESDVEAHHLSEPTETHTKGSDTVQQTPADVGVRETEAEGVTQPADTGSQDSTASGGHTGSRHKRVHYLGKSDRRGIINKRRKAFTQEQLSEMLHTLSTAESVDPSNLPGIAFSKPASDGPLDGHRERVREPLQSKVTRHSHTSDNLPVTQHEDVEAMLGHTRVLANNSATIPELLHALEELEDYAHDIDNAQDLNVIGGLVLVVRMLNHTHPDVRGHAAHVIGAAVQR